MRFILASASPARKQILEQLGVTFDVVPSDFDESSVAEPDPYKLCELLAMEKAEVVAQEHPDAVIIAADSFFVVDGRQVGKPRDRDDAAAIIRSFAGGTFDGLSSVAIARKATGEFFGGTEIVRVTFRDLLEEDIERYVEQEDVWKGKAGALTFEHPASLAIISYVHGDPSAIWGLPVTLLQSLLVKLRT